MTASILKRKSFWVFLLAVLIIVFPFLHNWPFFTLFIGEFRTFNATMFGIWLIILLGMNLLTGYSGQLSLGHAALVLISAYLTAILSQQYGFPLWGAVVLSAGVTGVLGGVVIGFPAVRLRGPYLAIATFGLMIALPQILKLNSLARWTNGANGVAGRSTVTFTALRTSGPRPTRDSKAKARRSSGPTASRLSSLASRCPARSILTATATRTCCAGTATATLYT